MCVCRYRWEEKGNQIGLKKVEVKEETRRFLEKLKGVCGRKHGDSYFCDRCGNLIVNVKDSREWR